MINDGEGVDDDDDDDDDAYVCVCARMLEWLLTPLLLIY